MAKQLHANKAVQFLLQNEYNAFVNYMTKGPEQKKIEELPTLEQWLEEKGIIEEVPGN